MENVMVFVFQFLMFLVLICSYILMCLVNFTSGHSLFPALSLCSPLCFFFFFYNTCVFASLSVSPRQSCICVLWSCFVPSVPAFAPHILFPRVFAVLQTVSSWFVLHLVILFPCIILDFPQPVLSVMFPALFVSWILIFDYSLRY